MNDEAGRCEPDDPLDEVVAEYLLAAEAGAAPPRQELLARYPELAQNLEVFFQGRERFNRFAASLRDLGIGLERSRSLFEKSLTLPCSFGDYELLEEMARGGMGVVYRARQKSVNRLVAVKRIRAGALASAADVQRFRNEAETVANLDHPHIVPLYEVGEHEGHPYFSMKLVDGKSLAEQLPRYQAEPRAAAGLLVQIARAVHHAHQRGVLHRDLKPSNVLLDAEDQPHVTDFGLAKRVETDSGLTQSGLLVGTPSYMAPEQASRRRQALTTAADVYGLGAVLYALLTGRPPFQGQTVLETLEQVKQQEPEWPSRRNPRVDRELEAVCLKCLDKEPARRYASAEALADDLGRWLERKPIHARSISRSVRIWRWCRRNPLVSALTATILLVLLLAVAGLALGSWLLWREQGVTKAALVRADAKNRWARRAVHDMYSQVAEQWLAHQAHMTDVQRQFLGKALEFYEELAKETSADPAERLERAIAYRRMGDIRGGGFHRSKGAEENYRQAVAICAGLTDEFPDKTDYREQLGRSCGTLGRFLADHEQLPEGEKYLLRARSLFKELVGESSNVPACREGLADTLEDIGVLWQRMDRLPEAEEALSQAVKVRGELVQGFPAVAAYREKLAFGYLCLGELLANLRRLAEAEPCYKKALALFEKALQQSLTTPWVRSTLGGGGNNLLADLLLDLGRSREAEEAVGRALAIRRKVDSDFPGMPYCWHGLAMTYSTQARLLTHLGRHGEAEEAYRQALDYQQKAVKDNPTHLGLRQNLALMYSNLAWHHVLGPPQVRRAHKALSLAQRALDLEPGNATYKTACGVSQYRLAEWTGAVASLWQAVRMNDRTDQPLRGWVADTGTLRRVAERNARAALVLNWFFLAMSHQQLGEADKAKDCYRRALERWQAQNIGDLTRAAELRGVQTEAAGLLGLQELILPCER